MEQYQDRYGIVRSRGRVGGSTGIAQQAQVRNAAYDFWGNLVDGQYGTDAIDEHGNVHHAGEQFQRTAPPMTNLDRYHAGAMTPGLDAWHRANPDQKTSWGQPWGEAVKAAQGADRSRTSMQGGAQKKWLEFLAARERIRRQGIDTTNPRPNVGSEDFAMNRQVQDPRDYSAWEQSRRKVTSAPYSGSWR